MEIEEGVIDNTTITPTSISIILHKILSLIHELLKNSFSVEQAISFFYCYRCFKISIIVYIDHLLPTAG